MGELCSNLRFQLISLSVNSSVPRPWKESEVAGLEEAGSSVEAGGNFLGFCTVFLVVTISRKTMLKALESFHGRESGSQY